ncbi:MAG TPA: pyruvate ferredoxin oxidoreductase [Deltaproteobacteria bacterium]|nr:pyruvate ferredoxin oxidoreductase [Deltaproteobacteria bacterium]
MAKKLSFLNKLALNKESLEGGHRLCPGCGHSIIVRMVLNTAVQEGYQPVMANSTGCLEVCTGLYPYSSWNIPWIHNAFENVAATLSGAESMYKSLSRRGKLNNDKIVFIAFGSDGGTYDIGLQALSGAAERGHRFLYVCDDNEAYQNTGNQRSSATPYGTRTTTSAVGTADPIGKKQKRKDIMEIMGAHGIYAAQASPAYWMDLIKKVKKGLKQNGPAYLNVIQPCTTGWGYEPKDTLNYAKLAVETCIWPLYEIDNRRSKINVKPKNKLPVEKYLKGQKRYTHLFAPQGKETLEKIQQLTDERWNFLIERERAGF